MKMMQELGYYCAKAFIFIMVIGATMFVKYKLGADPTTNWSVFWSVVISLWFTDCIISFIKWFNKEHKN